MKKNYPINGLYILPNGNNNKIQNQPVENQEYNNLFVNINDSQQQDYNIIRININRN